MFLQHLALTNFRNYAHLELDLPNPLVVFQGDNGQGKTNLLEAIYFLATTRSPRAGSDRELIDWRALEEPIPFARVAGTVRKARGDLRVEVVIRADRVARSGTALSEGGAAAGELSKRIKVNGIVRRALDLLGQITVVMFSPQDLELIAGPPALRRRYLDIANCQVDPRYCRALQQYNRVLQQRNRLLKQIRDGREPPETLEFWSDELVKSGAYLLGRRLATVETLNERIDGYFHRLTGTGRRLKMVYQSTVHEATDGGLGVGDWGLGDEQHPIPDPQLEGPFREGLRRFQRREMLHGVSLLGPHRDDLVFRADGIDMGVYGSRGEQRAVALALKLSEVEFMQSATGERPLLLLDDVTSELDPSRRALLMETLDPSGQILITATDLQSFPPRVLERAAIFQVAEGGVREIPNPWASS